MEAFYEFLLFRRMISIHALLVFYYLGAVGIPLVAWIMLVYLNRRFGVVKQALENGKTWYVANIPAKYRLRMLVIYLAMFLMLELFWRMMFEYLIAFMQMRNALVG